MLSYIAPIIGRCMDDHVQHNATCATYATPVCAKGFETYIVNLSMVFT